MRKLVSASLIFVVSLFLVAGCNDQGMGLSSVDQANLCRVDAWQYDAVAKECEPGQKVVFLPKSFGNEQLPVIFAAVNCDMTRSVALTKGGVTCIYQPITPAVQDENGSEGS